MYEFQKLAFKFPAETPIIAGMVIGGGLGAAVAKPPPFLRYKTESRQDYLNRKLKKKILAKIFGGLSGALFGAYVGVHAYKPKLNFDKDSFKGYSNSGSYYRASRSTGFQSNPHYNLMSGITTKTEASKRYRAEAIKHHPDKFQQFHEKQHAEERMKNLNQFWNEYKNSSEFSKLAKLLKKKYV